MEGNILFKRARALQLYGIIEHWEEVAQNEWLEKIIAWEEKERIRRSFERRLRCARLGRFKSLTDFDWTWPKKCDREIIEELMQLHFLNEVTNVIICGPNGVGKTTIARNLVHQTIINGYTALFITAGQMLNDLASQDGDNALRRRIKYYMQPKLLAIDEVGYLSYSNRHADLLFEIISRRYEEKPTLVTTNKPFNEWGEIFPNASCVVSLIDRLVHKSEIINIEASSFRVKEAKERKESRTKRKTLA